MKSIAYCGLSHASRHFNNLADRWSIIRYSDQGQRLSAARLQRQRRSNAPDLCCIFGHEIYSANSNRSAPSAHVLSFSVWLMISFHLSLGDATCFCRSASGCLRNFQALLACGGESCPCSVIVCHAQARPVRLTSALGRASLTGTGFRVCWCAYYQSSGSRVSRCSRTLRPDVISLGATGGT